MRIIKFIFPLTILNLITLILVTFGLPNIFPIYSNLFENMNFLGFRWFIPFFGIFPIIITSIYIFYSYYNGIDLEKNNIRNNLVSGIILTLIFLSWIFVFLMGFNNLNVDFFSKSSIDLFFSISILLAVFFIFLSYFLENRKSNNIFAIKNRWTLKNDLIWKKTHKLASYTSMVGGFILIIYSLATLLSSNIIYVIVGLLISVFLVVIVPILYSYYEFTKIIG